MNELPGIENMVQELVDLVNRQPLTVEAELSALLSVSFNLARRAGISDAELTEIIKAHKTAVAKKR